MFKYLSFTFGSFFIGLIVSLIALIVLIASINLWNSKRKHTPISYCVAALFAVILLVLNVTFCGLVKAKNQLDELQQSTEYRILNNGVDLINSYNTEWGAIASALIGGETSKEVIEQKKIEISKYLWIDGALCVVLFIMGMWATYATTEKNIRISHSSRSHRGDGERIARHSHRSDY